MSSNQTEERQYRYLVECGKYLTMSESFHRKGPNNHNLHMPLNKNKYSHIIWCSNCGTFEPMIDVQPLPTRKEAEQFLSRYKTLRNNEMNTVANNDSQ